MPVRIRGSVSQVVHSHRVSGSRVSVVAGLAGDSAVARSLMVPAGVFDRREPLVTAPQLDRCAAHFSCMRQCEERLEDGR